LRGAVAALGLVLAGWPLAAVGQTVINPDVGAARGLGTTVGQSGGVFSVDGGTRAGDNLFHSFSRFDLAAGDTARWVRSAGDGGSIANVVSRVTGGQVSTISGTIDSTALPNASFYFVNPAGIVFGAGAVVNVPSAAHFSTAGELRFANGDRFAIAAPDGSTLSVAAPESFGFVGVQGAIAVQNAGFAFTPLTANVSLTASDIAISNSQFAATGLDLVAVGDRTTTVRLADPLSAARGGQVSVLNSRVNVLTTNAPGAPLRIGASEIVVGKGALLTDTGGAGRGGDIRLQADRVAILADGFVISSTRGSGGGGDILVNAGVIDIDARGATSLTGFNSAATQTGDAGRIVLTADTINLIGDADSTTGGAFIGSGVIGAGDAGDILLDATSITAFGALVSSGTLGAGDGGNIRIKADAIDLGAANLLTSAFGAGRPGDVFIDGGSIVLSGGSIGSTPGGASDSGNVFINATRSLLGDGVGFVSSSFSANGAGQITMRAPSIELHDSRIELSALANGGAGRVLIEADDLIFDEVQLRADAANGPPTAIGRVRLLGRDRMVLFRSQVVSNALGSADGGEISLEGRDVQVLDTDIRSDSFFDGDAGSVALKGDTVLLSNAQLTSSTMGDGNGGDVLITARNVSLETDAALRADTLFAGKAGSVTIAATGLLDMQTGASITSRSQAGTGDAGSVNITAGRVTMATAHISSGTDTPGNAGSVTIKADSLDLDGGGQEFTFISTDTFLEGRGGDVLIDVKSLTLTGLGYISADTRNDGQAGTVTVKAGDLALRSGGFISSQSLGSGNAGTISVTAGKMTILGETGAQSYVTSTTFGAGRAGDIRLRAGSLSIDTGFISSDTFISGDAGSIAINADTLALRNGAGISSSTAGLGNAGFVDIVSKDLSLDFGSVIFSISNSRATGDARSVNITSDNLVVGKDASVTTATFGSGKAGELVISAKSMVVKDGGLISSSAEKGATGGSGTVRIVSNDLQVLRGGVISTLSGNPKPAGVIEITAGSLLVDGEGALISSENQAGNPEFIAPGMPPGPGGEAGQIKIKADGVTLSNGGRISTNSFAGSAGDIRITIDRPGLFVLEGGEAPGVIQTSSGPGTGGAITIVDPLAIISNGGRILALGQQRGANVQIQSRYFINSTDRLNVVDVDGDFRLQTGLYDVSSGTVSRDLSVLDASKVLRGQCPAARSTGAVSQLITRPVGPYAREAQPAAPSQPAEAPVGGCR
jgi:filamentous hemagglutinin family protein